MVHRGHRAVRVEPAEDCLGDACKLADLFGGQSVDHVLSDVGDVAGQLLDLGRRLQSLRKSGSW
jgi:hypothetical protein